MVWESQLVFQEVHKTERRIVLPTFLHVTKSRDHYKCIHIPYFIHPDDDNRVILTPLEHLTNEYVNASYVTVSVATIKKRGYIPPPHRVSLNRKCSL